MAVEGLVENIVFMSRVDIIDSTKAIITNADTSIECTLKAAVERVKVSLNDRDVTNVTQMQQYFRMIDLFQKDKTEDEALHFFYDTPVDNNTDMVLVKGENQMENYSRNK